MTSEGRHGPFERGPQDEHLAGMTAEGRRDWIEPVTSPGRFLTARRIVGWALVAVFVGLPHLTIGGKPGVLLDLPDRQFTFLGATFHPTDNVILLALGACVFTTIFFVTAVFGRIWCGWGCPQTVYLEFVFRPIETLIEGRPAVRRRRDAGPWTADRALRKASKWLLYLLVAGFLAHVFVSYFIGAERMWSLVGSDPWASRHIVIALVVVTGLMFFDFAFFREQTCTTACPYGRLQTVLYDPDTVIVGYDEKRGEPRGRRGAQSEGGAAALGDCIDCSRCVTTCPTGIDIRKGLQMECVGCAQCVDACDDVMTRIGKPRGLVRYTSERELEGGERRLVRPRLFVYLAAVLLAYGAFVTLVVTRSDADVEVLRGSRDPFRTLPTGEVANQLRARVTNNRAEAQSFTIELLEPAGGALVTSVSPLRVEPDAIGHVDLVVTLPRSAFERGRATARFRVTSDRGFDVEKEKGLLGPYGP